MIDLNQSDLSQLVPELLVIRASGHLFDSQRQYPEWELKNSDLKRLLSRGVGGVILVGGSVSELKQRSKILRSWAAKPLFLCADVEEGLGQRFIGGSLLVPPLGIAQIHRKYPEKALLLAEKYGICTGFQARVCGLNWVLAPVCDINNNPNNPVINMRAWGEDPFTVSALTIAFQRGLSSQGVLTCAKHFPGHGDTSVDSHLELPVLDHDLNRLQEIELLPFKEVVASGVDSVMSAHVLLRQIDPNYPATLSPIVLNCLREEIGFDGLLVTDALVMEAIKKSYGGGEAAVMAFKAGADLLMMPENPDEAIDAICQALLSGRIPMERLQQSLQRRKQALAKVDSLRSTLPTYKAKDDLFEVERAEDQLFAEELISLSIKVRNQEKKDLGVSQGGINLLRVDGVLPCSFLTQTSPAISVPQEAGYRTVLCHQLGVNPWQDDLNEPLALDRFGNGSFFLQLFLRGNPFRGDLNNREPWVAAVRQLEQHNRLSGIVIYGSPYLWDELIRNLDSSIPAAYSPAQMQQAQGMVLASLFQPVNSNKDLPPQKISDFTD
ncbi:glycoside hydrolase family 3 N-terminal domain-containing protein [Prochlorococcus sp. MIT 1307]|uniref:glycoside hydrolase family 3 N-terminal domain-containing protein n=1 Tax=Prochlorococcus sp. MIT 1307 TaxID=3096219 RepID=UPI002A757472|nr:glycoside hydrolase family 3 N-terminal domain-containing protein [Prochlorococcus sp. MIT 1307]